MNAVVKGTGEYWKRLAAHWKKLAPPMRPSKGDLKVYEAFLRRAIRGVRHPRILVMGATPEMRDLAHAHSAEVTVADFSSEMIKAMVGLMKYKKKTNEEVWVKGNWATLPLKAGYYDIILGDGVIDNVPWATHGQWLRHTRDLLKPDGAFITREFDNGQNLEKTIRNVLRPVLHAIQRSSHPSAEDLISLCFALMLVGADENRKIISDARNPELLKRYGTRFGLSKQKLKQLARALFGLMPVSRKEWRMHDLARTERELKICFRIIGKRPGVTKYLKDITYIYELKRP